MPRTKKSANAFAANVIDLANEQPIDHRELRYNAFLANQQGNILKGHGRDKTIHLLVRFDPDKIGFVKQWIASFAGNHVTSLKEQLRQRELYKRNSVGGGLFAGLYFTAAFFTDFGIDVSGLPNAEPFLAGMAGRTALNDPTSHLEDVYRQPLHAMILLAHDDEIALAIAAKEVCEAFEDFDPDGKVEKQNPIAKIVTAEYGLAIRNSNNDGLEHFGYVDGISQPLFLKDEYDEYKKRNVDTLLFDPKASLGLVLVKDALAPAGAGDAYGSYFVFRKLEQDVRGFKSAEEELGKTLWPKKKDKEQRERVGAMIVGRFEDGTPVTLSKDDKMISSGILNNFNYHDNGDGLGEDTGLRCPLHGHIRKTNPRTEAERAHRIARRGITYGHRNVSTTIDNHFVQMPKEGVGLLFMCFQADIEKQFEHIQLAANSPDFPDAAKKHADIKGVGVDLLIGNNDDQKHRTCPYAPAYNQPAGVERHFFDNFIRLKGGDYFYAPSLPFLTSLKPNKA